MRVTKLGLLSDQGGQAEIYKGRTEEGVQVALKYPRIPVGPSGIGDERARFEREINCQTQLRHPGIVRVLAVNLHDDPPYYVMPLATGSLRALLAFHATGMPEELVRDIFVPVLDAVAYAHQQSVLHRDLKPENILMFGDQPRIADFGLGRRLYSGSATLTLSNHALGTVQYAAPEQFTNARDADERADIYSLGRILYEMLTGERPLFTMDLSLLPVAYRPIVARATEQEPAFRYGSVIEFQQDVIAVADGADALLAPAEVAKVLVHAHSEGTGSDSDIHKLRLLLEQHGDDERLYHDVLVPMPPDLLRYVAADAGRSFNVIVHAMDKFSVGRFEWDYTDTLADFWVSIYGLSEDPRIRTTVLRRLLHLAHSHHRFYVRDRFVDTALEAIRDGFLSVSVRAVLHENPAAKTFVADALRRASLPSIITDELAA